MGHIGDRTSQFWQFSKGQTSLQITLSLIKRIACIFKAGGWDLSPAGWGWAKFKEGLLPIPNVLGQHQACRCHQYLTRMRRMLSLSSWCCPICRVWTLPWRIPPIPRWHLKLLGAHLHPNPLWLKYITEKTYFIFRPLLHQRWDSSWSIGISSTVPFLAKKRIQFLNLPFLPYWNFSLPAPSSSSNLQHA